MCIHDESKMHCLKSVHIRSFSSPYFPVFELNTERYSVQMREKIDQNNSEYGHFLRSVGSTMQKKKAKFWILLDCFS